MKTVIAAARNIRFLWNDETKKVEPEIEAVLSTFEYQHEFLGRELAKTGKLELLRFTMTIDTARSLSEQLTEWADTAEGLKIDLS